jgi:hypothetical protein
MIHESTDAICPRCLSPGMRSWDGLTDEQKMLAERLPLSAEYTPEERKKHRFCTRCWFEDTRDSQLTA